MKKYFITMAILFFIAILLTVSSNLMFMRTGLILMGITVGSVATFLFGGWDWIRDRKKKSIGDAQEIIDSEEEKEE